MADLGYPLSPFAAKASMSGRYHSLVSSATYRSPSCQATPLLVLSPVMRVTSLSANPLLSWSSSANTCAGDGVGRVSTLHAAACTGPESPGRPPCATHFAFLAAGHVDDGALPRLGHAAADRNASSPRHIPRKIFRGGKPRGLSHARQDGAHPAMQCRQGQQAHQHGRRHGHGRHHATPTCARMYNNGVR